MDLSYKDVTLDNEASDNRALLVFRNGRLLAVLSCLSDLHGELAGRWFIEVFFEGTPTLVGPIFETIAEFEEWLKGQQTS